MRLKSLVINNLYSFGEDVQCSFQHIGSGVKTLITGTNNDDSGADSNGSGKSSIPNIIFWTLMGEVFQKENVDEIVRRGTTQGSAELTIVDDVNNIKIERGRGKKKFLKLEYNGEDKTCTTDSETQKQLLKLFSIPPSLKPAEYINDFLNTTYFSTATVNGFMAKETTSKQRFALIERFLGLKRYSMASEIAKSRRKDILNKTQTLLDDVANKEAVLRLESPVSIENSIKSYMNDLTIIQRAISNYESQIESGREQEALTEDLKQIEQAINNRKQATIQQLDSLEAEYKTNSDSVADKQKDVSDYNELSKKVSEQSPKAMECSAKQKEVDIEAQSINTSVIKENSNLTLTDTKVNNIRNQIADHYTCPKCSEALMLQNNSLKPIDLNVLAQQLAEEESNRSNTLEKLNGHTKRLSEIMTITQNNNTVIQNYTNDYNILKTKKPIDLLNNEINQLNSKNQQLLTKHKEIGDVAKQEVAAMKQGLDTKKQRLKELSVLEYAIDKVKSDLQKSKSQEASIHNLLGQCEQKKRFLEQTQVDIAALQSKISTQKAEADIYGFWEIGFREIKIHIIDEFLPAFEDKVNEYLTKIKVNMKVDFDTQKRKSNYTKKDDLEGRSFKEEFNVSVFKSDEKDPGPFEMLSQGERARISTCAGMGLRELTKERGNNIFDFFFMDEIADALDETGLRELVSLLDDMQGQKIIISHNDEFKDYFENVINAEKTNGVSTINCY